MSSLPNQDIYDENELGTLRLGKYFLCVLCCDLNVTVIFQNENVNRAYTNLSKVKDLRCPDCFTDMKVLVKKTFKFVDLLWEMYVTQNKVDLR